MAPTSRFDRGAPFSSIVVATDFSLGAVAALQRAAQLPLAPRARVSLLYVRAPEPPRRSGGVFARNRLESAVQRFASAAHAPGHAEIRVTGWIATGRPYVEIIRHARRRNADLIVLGRHGQRSFRDLLIGSTAQRVVRKSEIPVLVVNRDPTGPYRRPLLAVDLEPASQRVAELAARVIGRASGTMLVVHAYEVPFEGWIAMHDRHRRADYRQARAKEASQALARFVALLRQGGLPCRPRVRYGDPRFVVLREAERQRSDLLILGTHGRAGAARALLGTVAETVAAGATCDVLIARPRGLTIRLP